MFKKIYIFLIIILLHTYAYGEEVDNLNTTATNSSSYDKFSLYEKELQRLISRIENLEHKVEELQKNKVTNADSEIKTEIKSETKLEIKSDVSQSNEKQDYDLALASLKEAGAIQNPEQKKMKLLDAQNKFSEFIKNYPNSQLMCNAYFWLGETFFMRRQFQNAAMNYLQSYKKSSSNKQTNNKAADALLKLGLSLGELNKIKEACGVFSKLDKEFPKRSIDSINRTQDACYKYGCKK